MSIPASISVYDNAEARCSTVLILDTSLCTYCRTGPIEAMNMSLPAFSEVIRGDALTALRADNAIVVCGLRNQVILDFTNGTDFMPTELPPVYAKSYSVSINMRSI